MTPLSEALTAAQKRALAALEKAYVAGHIDHEILTSQLQLCGLDEPVERDYLLCALDVLKTWGAPVPAETNGKQAEFATEKQQRLIESLCNKKNLRVPDAMGALTKESASEIIDSIDAGTYDAEKWTVPF